MAHPDATAAAEPGEHRVGGIVEIEQRHAIFALIAFVDAPAEQVGHELLPVTNPQHGLAAGEERRIYRGAGRIVDTAWPARDDNAPGRRKFASRSIAGANLGIYAQFA